MDQRSSEDGPAPNVTYRHVPPRSPHDTSSSSASSDDIAPDDSASRARDPSVTSARAVPEEPLRFHEPPGSFPRFDQPPPGHAPRSHVHPPSHHVDQSPERGRGGGTSHRSLSRDRPPRDSSQNWGAHREPSRHRHHSSFRNRSRAPSHQRPGSRGSMSSDTSSFEQHGVNRGFHQPFDPRYHSNAWAPPAGQQPPPHYHYGPPQGMHPYDQAPVTRRHQHWPNQFFPPEFPLDSHRRPPMQRPSSYYNDELAQNTYYNQYNYGAPQPPQMPMTMPMPMPLAPYMGAPSPAPPAAKTPPPPPPPTDSPEYKALREQFQQLHEAHVRAEEEKRAAERAAEREAKIRLEAEIHAIERWKEQQAAEQKRKDELNAAEKAGKEKSDKAAETKAAKLKEEVEKKAAEEKKKFDETEQKKKELEEELKKVKGDPDDAKPPLRIKDGVLDRKFDFPWAMAKSWSNLHKLLESAYEGYGELAMRITNMHFELIGPDKQHILPAVWETTVHPGWEVTVMMPNERPPIGPGELPGHMHDLHLGDGHRKHKHGKKKSSSKHKSSRRHHDVQIVDAPPMMHGAPGGGVPLYQGGPLPPGAIPMGPPEGVYEDLELMEDDSGRKHRRSGKKVAKSNGKSWFLGGGSKRK